MGSVRFNATFGCGKHVHTVERGVTLCSAVRIENARSVDKTTKRATCPECLRVLQREPQTELVVE